jgi:hypothetical protein
LTDLDGWYTKTINRLRVPKTLAGSKKDSFGSCQIIQDLVNVGGGEIRRRHRYNTSLLCPKFINVLSTFIDVYLLVIDKALLVLMEVHNKYGMEFASNSDSEECEW